MKPDNVMISGEGEVAITDFGIIVPYSSEKKAPNALSGTDGFMPPEQMNDHGLSPKTDICATALVVLACVFDPEMETSLDDLFDVSTSPETILEVMEGEEDIDEELDGPTFIRILLFYLWVEEEEVSVVTNRKFFSRTVPGILASDAHSSANYCRWEAKRSRCVHDGEHALRAS